MNLLKKLFRWWIDGWQVFIYYFAFYFFISFFLAVPIYFWKKETISNIWNIILAIIFFGIYLPVIFRFAAATLGKFPVEHKKTNP